MEVEEEDEGPGRCWPDDDDNDDVTPAAPGSLPPFTSARKLPPPISAGTLEAGACVSFPATAPPPTRCWCADVAA